MTTMAGRSSAEKRGRDGALSPAATTHLLIVDDNRTRTALVGEMLRSSWPEMLALTFVECLDDATPQLLSAAVDAVLIADADPRAALGHIRLIAPGVAALAVGPEYPAEEAAELLAAGAQDVLAMSELTSVTLRRAVLHAVERKRSEGVLAHRALQDPLTGLPNRTLFIDRLGVALDRARRTGTFTGVLFLDVDRFKDINDTLGHAAGDRVLTALAGRLRSVLRPMDTVARFGGDEFTFLFEDLSDADEALTIAERVREAAGHSIHIDDQERPLTVSIGVASTNDPAASPEALIRSADAAMYRSKGRGGGEATLATQAPDEHAAPDPVMRAEQAAALREAVTGGQLRVLYQPHYALERGGGQLVGFEALVRWLHPERGMLGPSEFIPLAEEIGLLPAIGRFVLGQALELQRWLRDRGERLSVTVNLSGEQLEETELTAAIAAIERSGVEPGSVGVDIPEAAISAMPERSSEAVRRLHAAGLRVAVDDYGTGSVSFQSLRRLGADELKVHGSIVGELDRAQGEDTVLGAVVELGHALGMHVTAEGVETDAQLRGLQALGCDSAMGYRLCRPIAADQLERLLVANPT